MRELLTAAHRRSSYLDEDLFWNAAEGILNKHNHNHRFLQHNSRRIAGLLFSAGRMSQQQLDELVVGYLLEHR